MNLMRWNPAAAGPLSEQGLRKKLERLGYSVTRYVYPPARHRPLGGSGR